MADLTASDMAATHLASDAGSVAELARSYHLPIEIRAARPSDEAFVFSGWLRSLSDQPPFRDLLDSRGLDRNWYSAAQHALISRLLARPGVYVLAATSPQHPDHLIGFMVYQPAARVVHWIYVKKGSKVGLGFRCAGVATRLMAHAFGARGGEQITASIRTATGTALASKWAERWPIAFRSHFLCEEQR